MSNLAHWIDAHHHLWDLEKVNYPWLKAKGEHRFFGQPDPIRKNYLLNNFIDDHQNEIIKSIHIQVGATAEESLKETQFIARSANKTDSQLPCKAVVAVDMLSDDVESQIQSHKAYSVTQGVRHIIGKSQEENRFLPSFDPVKWQDSLSILQNNDLSFDLQFTQEQYMDVLQVIEKTPELRVVICHLASPWDQTNKGFERWKKAMKQFAQLPNCFIKISGFSMFNHGMVIDNFFRYSHEAINIFSPKRCMFGSNFPVDKLYIDYQTLLNLWREIVSNYSQVEQKYLRENSARNFYQIDK